MGWGAGGAGIHDRIPHRPSIHIHDTECFQGERASIELQELEKFHDLNGGVVVLRIEGGRGVAGGFEGRPSGGLRVHTLSIL